MDKKINVKHMNGWEVYEHSNPKIVSPVMICGMPGIGNVGKICIDVLIENTKATLIKSFHSKHLPNSVFVNEDNLIDLPKLSLYHKKINNKDFLFLTGDVQPVDEQSSYDFSELVLQIFREYQGDHILTTGGIGLGVVPEHPKTYLTGNNKAFLEKINSGLKKKFKNSPVEKNIYGVVGPIMGISGLLLGVAKKHDMNAYCLLSETLAHPAFIGLKSSKAILNIIIKNYDMKISLEKLDGEIKQLDKEMNGPTSNDGSNTGKYKKYTDVNYIG